MQGLLQLQHLGSSGLVKNGSLTPLDGLLCCLEYRSALLPLKSPWMPVVKSPVTWDPVDNLEAFLLRKSMLDHALLNWVSHQLATGTESLPRFEDHFKVLPTAHMPDVLAYS